MLQLFIDTAVEKAFIGLANDGELMEMFDLPLGLQNSKFLFPALLSLLGRHSLTPKDLGLIGCGIGPGSYTGIRVAAAAAQSMAYALRLPLVGLPSLQAYAPSCPGSFAVALDARYGGVYLLKGESTGTSVSFESETHVVSVENIQEALKGISTLVTPHLNALQEKIGPAVSVKWEEGTPSGSLFSGQIQEAYKNQLFSSKAELKLLYLRKTQAEIEKMEKVEPLKYL